MHQASDEECHVSAGRQSIRSKESKAKWLEEEPEDAESPKLDTRWGNESMKTWKKCEQSKSRPDATQVYGIQNENKNATKPKWIV